MELYVFRRAASVVRFFVLQKECVFMNEEKTVKFLELVPGISVMIAPPTAYTTMRRGT